MLLEPTIITIKTGDKRFHDFVRESRIRDWFGGKWRIVDDKWTISGADFKGTKSFMKIIPIGDTDMGTKSEPAKNDCYHRALPDEPTFTLLARDPDFYELVQLWAEKRACRIACGDKGEEDRTRVDEARRCAGAGAKWRKENNGKWRGPEPGLRIGELYRWWEPRTGNTIMVRLVALEGDEACIHDGLRLNIISKDKLS
jgi:hypothetical protein